MTIFKPNKNNIFFVRIFVVLSLLIVGGVLGIVVLYNQSVNLDHTLKVTQSEFAKLQAQNAELKEAYFALFEGRNVETFAEGRSLIQEKTPYYLEVAQQWAFASR